MFWAILYSILPHPMRSQHKSSLYQYWLFSFLKPRVIAWHRKTLLSLDQEFRIQQEQRDLIKQREEYLARGGDPMDEDYPVIKIEGDFL